MPCCVIAEAGSCHDGRLDRALDLVGLARTIGADAVKFQWTSSAERLCDRRHAPEYRAAYELIAFPRPWLAILQDQAATLGLEFLCTVYLPEDVAVIAPLVARFKIASFEAEDAELRQAMQSHGKPIIVSTGMTRAGQGGGVGADLVLHCVSAYPTPLEELNLACLRAPGCDGLSDHSRHPWTGALAVAAGAHLVEFHMRLEATDPANADYVVARSPAEAAEYVANLRLAERMLGDGVKRVMPSEAPMLRYRVAPGIPR